MANESVKISFGPSPTFSCKNWLGSMYIFGNQH